jgi:hypothetical protein
VDPFVNHPCLWTASSFAKPSDYTLQVDSATCKALEGLRRELREGRGFVLLRGLPFDTEGIEWARAISDAIASRVGEPVSQTAGGDRVVDVADTTRRPT